MLDAFIRLATAAGEIGKVTAASLYPNDLIVIDVEQGGKFYTLTYRAVAEEENNGDS